MTTRLRAATAAAFVALATAAGVVGVAAPALAGSCTAAEVAVVVDFAALGGGVRTGCTRSDPGSGVEALTLAGFRPERAALERSGYFLCRIDGQPTSDPCQRAAASSAYWSYWHAKPGGTWSFSNTGPGTFDPAPGTVEGWAFGAGNPPAAAPPSLAAPPSATTAPAPAPAPTAGSSAAAALSAPSPAPPRPATSPTRRSTSGTTASANPAGTAGPTSEPAAGTASAPPAAAAEEPAVPVTAGPEATPSSEPPPTPTPSDPPPPSDVTARPASTRSGSGSAGPLAAAVLVVALLAGAGWQQARRRHEPE